MSPKYVILRDFDEMFAEARSFDINSKIIELAALELENLGDLTELD